MRCCEFSVILDLLLMALLNDDIVSITPSVPSDGIPTQRRFEDTADIKKAVDDAVASEGSTDQALARLILSTMRPPDGDVGTKVLKDMKKHKWLAGLMALVLGPGGMIATYYAVKDRGIANEAAVTAIKEELRAGNVRERETTDEITLIKSDISKINTWFESAGTKHQLMLDGIQSLRQVNVTRLEKENDKLEQELRRQRNINNRSR